MILCSALGQKLPFPLQWPHLPVISFLTVGFLWLETRHPHPAGYRRGGLLEGFAKDADRRCSAFRF